MRKFIESLKARREASKNEGGFSLIDVVITVAIIVALSVGGFVTYNGIVDNAKQAATSAAADQVFTAVVVASSDGGIGTVAEVVADYNGSNTAEENEGIFVTFTDVDTDGILDAGDSITATHKDGKTATRTA